MSRIRKISLVLCIILSLSSALACSVQVPKRYETVYYDVFDTITKLSGYAESEQAFLEECDKIHASLLEYHRLYDIYHVYPDLINLKTINDSAGGEPLKVDPRIMDLLVFAARIDAETDHRVDITLGPVLSLWHEARESALSDPDHAKVPDADLLKEASLHVGFHNLEINADACTVRLLDPLSRLDVGALAKGYVAEKVGERMPDGYLISLGGNVLVKGTKPSGELWNIGIQDPADSSRLLRTVQGADLSVVTSGDYQRTFQVGDTSYHHIIDPETLYPSDRWRSVTVVCKDSALADALSTALFLLDREAGQRLLSRFSGEALWIALDGTEYTSNGFPGKPVHS